MKVSRSIAWSAVVVAVGAVVGAVAGQTSRSELGRIDGFLQRYTGLLRVVLAQAPADTAPADLVYGSFDGMLALLDPHSNFLRPDVYAHMRERQQGSFHGIGVIISLRGGRITVITPVEGTPAARLGLRAGDVIEAIDQTSTDGMDLDEAARRLRGPESSKVRITISRPGLTHPLDLEIERARVPSESVRYAFLLDETTGYLRVSDFIHTTGEETAKAVDRLAKGGATRLIIDLRDNPGGLVDSAVAVASILLEPGEQVFSTKGRTADSFQDYRAARDGVRFTGPLVVLVNRGSASAAEIVAGAVQDHDRGLVIGETSFGKGVVQTIYPLRESALALTTAKYYTPSGRCIQRDYDSYFDYVHHGEEGASDLASTPPRGPVFFTDSGRKVYGGGGISPDSFVSLSEYSERLARLVGQSAFFHFAVAYLSDKADKPAAARAFSLTDATIAAFRDRVIAEKWLPAADIDAALGNPRDRRDIEIAIRAEVLNAGASIQEGYKAFTAVDEQIQAATQSLLEAAKLQARAHRATTTTTAARNR